MEDGEFEWGDATVMDDEIADVAVGGDRVVASIPETGAHGEGSQFAISGDASMWMLFDQPSPGGFDQITHTGGVFWATRSGNGTGSRLFSSRDGARWADRSDGVGESVLHSMAAGKGVLVAVGDGGVILHRSANLPPAIVSEPPAEVSAPAGHPLLLAVEADIGEETSVSWRKDGQPIPGQDDLTLEIPAVAPDDAGTYTVFLSNDYGFVESAASTVTVGPATSEPIPWDEAALLEGNLSRLAVGNGHLLALAHHGDFHESLRLDSSERTLPAAWSGNGYHWREAAFTRGRNWEDSVWMAAGFAKGHFWMGRDQHIALSEDGIAWRQVRIDTDMHVMLVGEHQGKFFATSEASRVWESEDGEEWTLLTNFPVPWAGDYISNGEELLVASHAGIVRWDGTNYEGGGEFDQGAQPRIAQDGETFLFLPRDAHQTYAISGDLKSWTTMENTLDGARDLLGHGGSFMAVGPEDFQTSNDGIWWADRSDSLDTITVSAIAAAGEQLFAVGDQGKVLRRPAALEPAFYQQPRGIDAIRGQPVRLTARATGSEPISYQWYRDGVAIEAATDSALEFDEVSRMDAGEYHVVATNTTGSVVSETAAVTVVLRTPEPVPWERIAQLPSGFNIFAEDGTVVSGEQQIVAVDGREKVVAVSEDGREWLRTRVSGTSGNAERSFADRVFRAGGKFFAAGGWGGGSGWVAVSDDGVAWRILDLEADVTDIAFGNGIFVIVTGSSAPAFRSADLLHWSELDVMGMERVRFGNGRFVGVSAHGSAAVSQNGVFWSLGFLDEAFSQAFEPPRAMAFGNGVFVVRVAKDGVPYFYRSSDGENWEAAEAAGPFYSLTFQGNDFWQTAGDPANLFASTSSGRWVNRQVNLASDHPARVAAADEVDIIALAGNEVYRRSILLEPVFYADPPDYAVYPEDDLLIGHPESHGSEAEYNWFTPLGNFYGERFHEIQNAGPDDGGTYRVTANNPSGGDVIEFSVHYLGGFEDWAEVYHRDGHPREKTADPDGLGIPNLLRYALHLDPENPDRSKLPRMETIQHDGKDFPGIRFQLLDAVEDYEWWLEASDDLQNWSSVEGGHVESSELSGRVKELLVRDPTPVEAGERRFLRLRIQKGEAESN